MQTSNGTRLGRLLAGVLLLTGCTGQHPFVARGNASGVVVTHSEDIEGATEVARRYCAGYERVPHLLESTIDTAYFGCVSR